MSKSIWIYADTSNSELKKRTAFVSQVFSEKGLKVQKNVSDTTDIVFCLGGDGSYLSAIRQIGSVRHKAVVAGAHSSSGLGFLYPVSFPKEESLERQWAERLADLFLKDKYETEARFGLEATLEKNSKQFWGMNDLVFCKGSLARIIKIRVWIDNNLVYKELKGDGLIVSSPTGSTAYSLSAGGPVIAPGLKALLMTPICPHEIALRPLVVESKSVIRIEILKGRSHSHLTEDGQKVHELHEGDVVEIRRAQEPIKWWIPDSPSLETKNFYALLSSKIGFGGDRFAR